MTRFYCRMCASRSRLVIVESITKPYRHCPSCHMRAWSDRRWLCKQCVDVGYSPADYIEATEEPTRACVRGHHPRWIEDVDSAWALSAVRNRVVRPEPVR